MVESPAQVERVAIAGAGICGLCVSLALAQQGHSVTVFERDETLPDGSGDYAFYHWQRRGAAQFRHPHAFLGLMCNLLQDHYPDLLEELYQAGARRIDLVDMLRPELLPGYQPQAGDEKLWILMCRRAIVETVLRRYVQRLANVTILSDTTVLGLISEKSADGTLVMHGLEYGQGGQQNTFAADIVIDASGRGSRFPRWFKALDVDVEETRDDAEIVYFTRHYRLNPGCEEPPRHGAEPAAGDLAYLKYGVFPGDDGNFAVILCLPLAETELRHAVRFGEGFDAIARSIPGVTPWLEPAHMSPTTEPFGMAGIQAVWRHYVSAGRPLALNFFAVGDAAIRTNPLYGRGCSIGMQHAHILAAVIAGSDDPVQRATEFAVRTEEQIRPIYKSSLDEDRAGIKRAVAAYEGRLLHKPRSFKKWFALAFGDALGAAVKHELHVVRGVMRTFHLLEKPGEFLRSKRIQWTVYRYMLRGRKRNAAERIVGGPARVEMHALVAGLGLPLEDGNSNPTGVAK